VVIASDAAAKVTDLSDGVNLAMLEFARKFVDQALSGGTNTPEDVHDERHKALTRSKKFSELLAFLVFANL